MSSFDDDIKWYLRQGYQNAGENENLRDEEIENQIQELLKHFETRVRESEAWRVVKESAETATHDRKIAMAVDAQLDRLNQLNDTTRGSQP